MKCDLNRRKGAASRPRGVDVSRRWLAGAARWLTGRTRSSRPLVHQILRALLPSDVTHRIFAHPSAPAAHNTRVPIRSSSISFLFPPLKRLIRKDYGYLCVYSLPTAMILRIAEWFVLRHFQLPDNCWAQLCRFLHNDRIVLIQFCL